MIVWKGKLDKEGVVYLSGDFVCVRVIIETGGSLRKTFIIIQTSMPCAESLRTVRYGFGILGE